MLNKILTLTAAMLIGSCAATWAGDGSGVSSGLTLTLEDCVRLAEENNADIRGARLDIRAAELQKDEALAEYFPRVSATGFGFYSLNPLIDLGVKDIVGNNDLGNNLDNILAGLGGELGIPFRYTAMQKGYMVGIVAMQPLYAGGRIVNGNRLAQLGVRAAELTGEMSRLQTVSSIEQTWWQAASLADKKTTLERVIEILDELGESADEAVAAGLIAETDALQLSLRRSETRSQLKQVESGIRLIKMNLLNSIGVQYSVLKTLSSSEKPYLDDITLAFSEDTLLSPEHYRKDEQEVVSSLVESQLLDLQVDADRLQKKMALGEALPQVAVGVAAGYSDFLGKGRSDALAVATVSIPISDWGKTSKKLQRLQTQVDKAEEQRDYLQRQLTLMVASLWLDMESKYDAMLNSEESLGIATRLFDVARQNYAAGLIAVSDLLTAEASYRQAATEHVDAVIAYRNAIRAYQHPTAGQQMQQMQ